MLFPTLNCLQRGQVGLLVTYLTLLGLRLSLGGGSWRGWAAGGAALALAVTVKLTPIMPALFLLAMLGLPVVMGWSRRKLARPHPCLAEWPWDLCCFCCCCPRLPLAGRQTFITFIDGLIWSF